MKNFPMERRDTAALCVSHFLGPAITAVTTILASWIPLPRLWATITIANAQAFKVSKSRGTELVNIQALAAAPDFACLPPVQYAYDPLPAQASLNDHHSLSLLDEAMAINPHFLANSIDLDPFAARLPYRSGLNLVRASRYWSANLSETVNLLALLATNGSASDIEVRNGITLAKLARKALAPGREQQIVLATLYMFPAASEERIKQIAALMVIYFVFDDKVEETPNEELQKFRNDFLHRLEGHGNTSPDPSALQNHIDSVMRGIQAEDLTGGDGGKEMVQVLRGAVRCVRPDESGFQNVLEYLDFRRQNVGAAFVIAAAKFSVKSTVDTDDPRFSRFLNLISDHLGLVNDLASYDKELRALSRGETNDMINLIHVIKTVTGLQNTDDAKSVAWALQLQIERMMITELANLKSGGNLTCEEWWFLEAVITTATGNVIFCMTTSRYGGEAARL